jgi:hypothetical protein
MPGAQLRIAWNTCVQRPYLLYLQVFTGERPVLIAGSAVPKANWTFLVDIFCLGKKAQCVTRTLVLRPAHASTSPEK